MKNTRKKREEDGTPHELMMLEEGCLCKGLNVMEVWAWTKDARSMIDSRRLTLVFVNDSDVLEVWAWEMIGPVASVSISDEIEIYEDRVV